jgi:hypothetical protein
MSTGGLTGPIKKPGIMGFRRDDPMTDLHLANVLEGVSRGHGEWRGALFGGVFVGSGHEV